MSAVQIFWKHLEKEKLLVMGLEESKICHLEKG